MGDRSIEVVAMGMRPRFTQKQKAVLRQHGLYEEQIDCLEATLPAVRSAMQKPVPMTEVFDWLKKVQKPLQNALKRYHGLKKYVAGASGEVLSRLHIAEMQQVQNPHEIKTLGDHLNAANDIVSSACASVPRRSRGRRIDQSVAGHPIQLILNALERGHSQHFTGPSPPAFGIRVSRTMAKVRGIVEVISEVTGSWSAEEAIRQYQQKVGGSSGRKSRRSPKTPDPST